MSDRFTGVRAALDRNLGTGEELGASIFVDVGGEAVLDLWGGYQDQARTRPWQADTIVNVWSITKLVTAVSVLVLADRGLLDLDAPVAAYWPEFAANGKQDIPVRAILGHTSGVSGLDQPATLTDLYDAEKAAARMAAQAPWWPPGSASGYHLFSQGHLLGELVRRVTGKTLGRFIAEEVAGPLGADFQLGARREDWPRVAEVVPPPPSVLDGLDPESPAARTFAGPAVAAEDANTPGWRTAEVGAANGHGNARSVARILSAIPRLLSPATVDRIFEEQSNGIDVVNGLFLRWGMGFALSDPRTLPEVPPGRVAYWGGWGGSMAILDLDRRVTIAYVMNRMAPGILGSRRSREYVEAVYRALGT
ncbi:serine hydrolase domain-containing protein [Amycolatopsis sacchari]|uniref:serine hydrolase domain-containing protein n=1 Tax=Amycolatopsis sacchari TaxID=115433 RepID=UPI003D721DAE